MSKLRILHTESSLGWGGQEIRVLTEARGMAARGHEVTLAAAPGSRILGEAPRFGVRTLELPIARKSVRGLLAMRGLLASRAFDVVNTHSSTDTWLTALARVKLARAPALVRTRHISAPVPRNFATRWLYRDATARIVTTGERLRRQVVEEADVDPSRVVSIPTGIDLQRFRPGDRAAARAALGLPAGTPLVGIVATLRSWKGHRYLLEALAKMRARDAILAVVGDGPQREALGALASSLGVAGRVRFAGNREDVAPWLQALDVFCLPSYANEGVPQALMQAMACGLAVVTTPVGSIPEIVADGESGVVVPPEDAAALGTALDGLLADPARRAALGARAAAVARERFDEATMLDRMAAVFAEAAGAAPVSRVVSRRFVSRTLVVTHALARRAARGASPAGGIRRVLVASRLLLGDTLMLTPLLAKLRATHPDAEITLLAAPAFVPLYHGRPYGVRALPFEPKDAASTRALLQEEGSYDLAIVPGDNRFSWIAAALRARRIVAHSGDRPWMKSWCVDESRPYRDEPASWGDMVADLVDGEPPAPFARSDWPAPPARPFARPAARYAVLHVGASTPLKLWPAKRWGEVAAWLEARGVRPVWSGGRDDIERVRECDPAGRFESFAGRLDLPQMWHLLAGASVVVAPDTGIAHLGRAAFAPTVVLFGPGSAVVCGPGSFWRDTPWRAVTVDPFPCRDQHVLFRRDLAWVSRCGRSTAQCAEPRCMHAIETRAVIDAVNEILPRTFVSQVRSGAA